MTLTALLLAAGAGTRLGGDGNKVYLPLAGRPLLVWSLMAFERSRLVDDIVLVVRDVDRAVAQAALAQMPATKVRAHVAGGHTRHDSEEAGLDAIAGDIRSGRTDLVLIHDAARPFVGEDLLGTLITEAGRIGAAIPGLQIDRPLYRPGPDGRVTPLPTADIRRVQTPQVFRAGPLLDAYEAAAREGFSGVDTSHTVERYTDLDIAVVPGDPRNIKVTYAHDLAAAERLALAWSD